MIYLGLDVGSTTLKCVVTDENNKIIFSKYERHLSQISEKLFDLFKEIEVRFPKEKEIDIKISGSAGMGIAQELNIPFVQEVFATRLAVKELLPNTDVVIELGGEDAKIIFLTGGIEAKMNGTCAGGTGAFIDQMATLLSVNPDEMNEMAKDHEKIYSIASRCGVFAKTDIQPLLNQGARKEDISASILVAVVNQTIGGLAQGREIKGNIVYLGGPLSFFSELRKSFDKTLNLNGICPENSLFYVAFGTAISKSENKIFNLTELSMKIKEFSGKLGYDECEPLFINQEEFDEFLDRHSSVESIGLLSEKDLNIDENSDNKNKIYIGIDAGSTTLKVVVLNEKEQIIFSKYMPNGGTPVPLVKKFFIELYEKFPNAYIGGFVTTGYGEDIIKNAFKADFGIVETIAHFTAAKKYNPNVDFIIDIGGQDIKCFKIRNGVIDNIFLNEACSSGCGSFLQTFAEAMGKNIEEFSKVGLFAKKPVDLGSRCTVFMNSSVKQAQKDGAGFDNISAGLSISVVKNALYKVIRATSSDSLGENIVVQGGTFLNDAVLRAFEKEIGRNVTRPNISGHMGAFGAALYAKELNLEKSTCINFDELTNFKHEVKATICNKCENKCKLTVNYFDGGRSFIGGNRCEKPLGKNSNDIEYNLFDFKKSKLASYKSFKGKRQTVGIPMVLNMFELLPFWHKFFECLEFGVEISSFSTRETYFKGQHTIPSDTVCYPAKIVHGHIEELIEKKVDAIFYPCMSYNIDEKLSDNNYNCPVVAYYPEVIDANIDYFGNIKFLKNYFGLHRKKDFPKKIYEIIKLEFPEIKLRDVQKATKYAFEEYHNFMESIKEKGKSFYDIAVLNNQPIIILAGRPYHLDPEINHGIDKLVCECGAIVLTEDAISHLGGKVDTSILNQWTYHSRLYSAAKFAIENDYNKIDIVQLVSFGCGVDSITTDEVRRILETHSKIYTQIKIDEITNLGAVKIRLRSLFAAVSKEN